jgi:hypothetical protein
MPKKYFILILVIPSLTLLFFSKCSPSINISKQNSDSLYFNFCDFPQNLNQRVRILGNYSGIEEYWSIYSIDKCENKFSVDFEIDAVYNKLTSTQKELFSKLINKYWKYYLLVDVSGRFEMNGKGYGHLDHNQAVFIADTIFSLKLMETRKK